MYSYLDLSTANSGLGTALRPGGQIINDNFLKLSSWMNSRANIVANSIKTLAEGGPTYLLATEYSAGNPMALACYKRRSGAPTDTTNPGFILSPDGQWWELMVANGGEVFIEQFGGKADFDTSNPHLGTLNWQPLMWALGFTQVAAGNRSPVVRLGFGKYKIEKRVMFRGLAIIKGTFSFHSAAGGMGTQLHFRKADGTKLGSSAFVFLTGNTGLNSSSLDDENAAQNPVGVTTWGADGSYIGGFSIHGTWDGVTQWNLNGIGTDFYFAAVRIRASEVTCDSIGVYNWDYHAWHIHGAVVAGSSYPYYSNVNEWYLTNCYAHTCAGIARFVAGNDANAGVCIKFKTQVCGGTSLYEGGAFANTYIGDQITGYGDKGIAVETSPGVWRYYQYTGTGDFQATVPGTNNQIWYDLGVGPGPNARFLEYGAVTTDLYSVFSLVPIPYSIHNGGAVLIGPYVETVVLKGYSTSESIYGGTSTWTSNSANLSRGARTGGYFAGMTGSTSLATYGETLDIQMGGPVDGSFDLGINFASYAFDSVKQFSLDYTPGTKKIRARFLAPEAQTLFELHDKNSTEKFGGNSPVANVASFPEKLGLVGVLLGSCVGGPPTAYGEYPQGSLFIRKDAAAGDPKIYMTTTPGALTQQAWGPGDYPANHTVTVAGKHYRAVAFGASTTAPTHTTTTAAVNPGGTVFWWYMGNTAPVFTGIS